MQKVHFFVDNHAQTLFCNICDLLAGDVNDDGKINIIAIRLQTVVCKAIIY